MTKQPHTNYCGAKTRSGNPCKNRAMPNGRCRMHGGKATGAPTKNKNAVTHGEHEAIWVDTLEVDERVFFDAMSTVDVLKHLDDEIRLMTIRERRMMQRIADLKQHEFTVVSYKTGTEKGDETDIQESEGTLGQIQAIEEALTRVQDKKSKMLEMKHKIQDGDNSDDTDDWVAAIKAVAERRKKAEK
jgi:uncharacterized protein YjcR